MMAQLIEGKTVRVATATAALTLKIECVSKPARFGFRQMIGARGVRGGSYYLFCSQSGEIELCDKTIRSIGFVTEVTSL